MGEKVEKVGKFKALPVAISAIAAVVIAVAVAVAAAAAVAVAATPNLMQALCLV